jgi:hypothetical protein
VVGFAAPLAVDAGLRRSIRPLLLRPGIQNWNQFTGASLKFGFTSDAVTVVSPQTTPGDGTNGQPSPWRPFWYV